MKKHIFMIAAVLTGLSLTACGPDSVNVNVALSGPAVTTLTEEAAQTETTVTATETAAAETVTETAAVTNAASEESAQTTAALTTVAAPATDCPYAVSDLAGEWVMPGTFGGRNNSMTVQSDGSVILRYAAGGTRTGKLRIDKEEHPDGTAGYWYSVYGDDNTAWIGFSCGELPVSKIASGHDGEMQFVRISLEEVAAEKMNNLTFLMQSMSGGGGDLAIDREQTVTVENQTYALVSDNRFGIGSLGKAAFERLLEETASGAVRTDWQKTIDASFTVQDGQTYVLITGAHGFHTFETGHGVTITDRTDTSFNAVTVDANQLDGRGYAHFVFDGTNWTIDSYEFK